MAQTCRPQVTITLGRSGSVVKKAFAPDNGFSDPVPLPAAGSKRSVKDRLGRKVDDSLFHEDQPNNKRLRGDDNRARLQGHDLNGMCMCENDLRFKLMQKQKISQTKNDGHHNSGDLREKLSSKVQASLSRINTQTPVRKDTRFLVPVHPSRNGGDSPPCEPLRHCYSAWNVELRQRYPERILHSSRALSPPHRNREKLPKRGLCRSFDDVSLVSRERSPEIFLRKSRGLSPLHRNREEFQKRAIVRSFDEMKLVSRQRFPERTVNSYKGLSPPHRNREELRKRALGRSSDDVRLVPRRRSPERSSTSRGFFTAQGNIEERQKRALLRSLDDVRPVPCSTKDVYALRSVVAAPSMEKPTLPAGSVKPIEPVLAPAPPSGNILPKSSYLGDEESTLGGLLNSLGLGKYALLFKAEEGFSILFVGAVKIIIFVGLKANYLVPSHKDEPTRSQVDCMWLIILMFGSLPALLTY